MNTTLWWRSLNLSRGWSASAAAIGDCPTSRCREHFSSETIRWSGTPGWDLLLRLTTAKVADSQGVVAAIGVEMTPIPLHVSLQRPISCFCSVLCTCRCRYVPARTGARLTGTAPRRTNHHTLYMCLCLEFHVWVWHSQHDILAEIVRLGNMTTDKKNSWRPTKTSLRSTATRYVQFWFGFYFSQCHPSSCFNNATPHNNRLVNSLQVRRLLTNRSEVQKIHDSWREGFV